LAVTINNNRVPIALTIAGSDSGGGAGIQADIKTFSSLGVYAASVITAVTAQDTKRVYGFVELEPSFVAQQIDVVLDDMCALRAGDQVPCDGVVRSVDGLNGARIPSVRTQTIPPWDGMGPTREPILLLWLADARIYRAE